MSLFRTNNDGASYGIILCGMVRIEKMLGKRKFYTSFCVSQRRKRKLNRGVEKGQSASAFPINSVQFLTRGKGVMATTRRETPF